MYRFLSGNESQTIKRLERLKMESSRETGNSKQLALSLNNRPDLKWLDQWGPNILKDPINELRGEVQLNIPLIDVTHIAGWALQLILSYNSNQITSGLVGLGWSLSLDLNYIYVDYGGSSLPDDMNYFLILSGHPHRLAMLETSDNNVKKFQLAEINENQEDLLIQYYTNEQKWIIDSDSEQLIYGKSEKNPAEDAFLWSLHWPNWNSVGRDIDAMNPLVVGWYLNTRYDKNRNKHLYYYYKEDKNELLKGKTYTSDIRLTSIKDESDLKFVLEYDQMESNEYIKSKPMNENGDIRLPMPLENKYFLKKYTLETKIYRQEMDFQYKMKDDVRVLKRIRQRFLTQNEPILEFNYQKINKKHILKSYVMSQINAKTEFLYEKLEKPQVTVETNINYSVGKKPKVAYGPDYAVMVSVKENIKEKLSTVVVKITNRSMTKLILDCLDSKLLNCFKTTGEIKSFNIQTFENTFIVQVVENSQKHLFMISRKENNNWVMESKIFTFHKDTLIRFSGILIIAAQPETNEINILEFLKSRWIETKLIAGTNKKITRLTAYKKLTVVSNNKELWLIRKNSKSTWEAKLLISDITEYNEGFTNKLYLDKNIQSDILYALNQNGLQLANNLIALSDIKEIDGRISLAIRLLLLDSNYEIAFDKTIEVPRENIYESTMIHEQDESVFTMGYVKNERGFKVCIKDVSGAIMKEVNKIDNSNRREDAKSKLIDDINKNPGWQKVFQHTFLLNLDSYAIQATMNGVQCGINTLLQMTGTDWVVTTVPKREDVVLGNHFSLKSMSSNGTILKLFQDGKQVKKFELYAPTLIINRFPAYIAYQPHEMVVKVLLFENGESLGEMLTFKNEKLLFESDYENLLTIESDKKLGLVRIKVRALSSLASSQERIYVSKLSSIVGGIERTTGYEHSYLNYQVDKQIADTNLSELLKVIPANNKKTHGWHEIEKRSFNDGNFTKTERWFNEKMDLVLQHTQNKASNEFDLENISETQTTKLFDTSGQLLITDFSPYKVSDQTVAYYGFESYESKYIGSKNVPNTESWRFDDSQVVKDGFSFTGKNYLHLPNQATFFEGLMAPKNPKLTYLISSWVRCNTSLTINDTVPFLKVTLQDGKSTKELHAQVKQVFDNWYYLESTISFKTNPAIEPTIKIRIQTTGTEKLDVDHIRFSPINLDHDTIVYDHLSRKSTDIIKSNGMVYRTIYSRLNRDIANIQLNGQVERVSSTVRYYEPTDGRSNKIVLKPQKAYYENFSPYTLRTKWNIQDPSAWKNAPGQLWHTKIEESEMKIKSGIIEGTILALRFNLDLLDAKSYISMRSSQSNIINIMRQEDGSASCTIFKQKSIQSLPSSSELILVLTQKYAWLWYNGALQYDEPHSIKDVSKWDELIISAKGYVLFEHLFLLSEPQITVEYENAFGEIEQIIQLENPESAIISETLYDDVGRPGIVTKATRIFRKPDQSLLAYRKDFVTNKDFYSKDSVWETGIIKGEVDIINPSDKGFAYSRTKYAPNPLNEDTATGLPGKDYSIEGSYSVKKNTQSGIIFLNNLFPEIKGFTQEVEYAPNGACTVYVYDDHDNQISIYVRVPGSDHILSTFEYDEKNRLIKILPPSYHEKVGTASKTKPYQFQEALLSMEEKQWQKALGTYFIYNKNDQLIQKITPDTGIVDYFYTKTDQKRFLVSKSKKDHVENIIYYKYNQNNQIIESGFLSPKLSNLELQSLLEANTLPSPEIFQEFRYCENHLDPLVRRHTKNIVTKSVNELVKETLKFNDEQQMVFKSTQIKDHSYKLKKSYKAGKLDVLEYPSLLGEQSIKLIHIYNEFGQLIRLSSPDNPSINITFTYNPDGQIESEEYYKQKLVRQYKYNSPGFLIQIADPYLIEDITYENQGYGQSGFGDGIIMGTFFQAKWPLKVNKNWFIISKEEINMSNASSCIKALKARGYLSDENQSLGSFIKDKEMNIPLYCPLEKLLEMLAKKQPPSYYGHRLSYGNHQELVKAKYINDFNKLVQDPLQPHSFKRFIQNLTVEDSEEIWKKLKEGRFIVTDQRQNDPVSATAKRGRSLIRMMDLWKSLGELNPSFLVYNRQIEKLILNTISEEKNISLDNFSKIFSEWKGEESISSQTKNEAQEIGQMLISKKFLPTNALMYLSALDDSLIALLSKYNNFTTRIVGVLYDHFSQELGQTPFDVESYEIDPNGNHRMFNTGFNQYEFSYKNATNQIQSIKKNENAVFEIEHNSRGNVIKALHKQILQIVYHPVSQRTIKIILVDGRKLEFAYDAQGERIIKRVITKDDKIESERLYVRDEQGKVLVDVIKNFSTKQEILTKYVYGPKGLLGFIKNNTFYSVTLDHLGSVRLITTDDQVVAAFDYMPYGELMRSFGNGIEKEFVYRFNGQEYDEETGLYNFHARLYDSELGRFYQPDPKAQYYSPYKYAGNSPVSLVDPNGEEAILLTISIVCAIVGGYLGGAAVNNRWNPVEWDYKDVGTYTGVGLGAISGYGMPGAFIGSAALIGTTGTTVLGVGGAYLTTAALNNDWDPTKWEWDRPTTWGSLYGGFGMGSGFVEGIANLHRMSSEFSSVKAQMFLSITYGSGAVMSYKGGVQANNGNLNFWEWDWTDPTTWSSVIKGFKSGLGIPKKVVKARKTASKIQEYSKKYSKKISSLLDTGLKKKLALKNILKSQSHPLHGTTASAVLAHFMGATPKNDLEIQKWAVASYSSYEAVLNTAFFSHEASTLMKLARDSKVLQATAKQFSKSAHYIYDGETQKLERASSSSGRPALWIHRFFNPISDFVSTIGKEWLPYFYFSQNSIQKINLNSRSTITHFKSYNSHHLNGALQLIDLVVRKWNGIKYCQSSSNSEVTEGEMYVMAAEMLSELNKTSVHSNDVSDDFSTNESSGSYETYKQLVDYLVTGNRGEIEKLLNSSHAHETKLE